MVQLFGVAGMRGKFDAFVCKWALAVACVLGPLALGVFGNGYLVSRVTRGSELCAITRQLPLRLLGDTAASPLKLSDDDAKRCDQAVATHWAKSAPMAAVPSIAAPAKSVVALATAPAPAAAANEAKGAGEEKSSPQLAIVANHIAGRLNVAYAYAFLLLVSVAAFAFGSYVVVSYWGWIALLLVTVAFGSASYGISLFDLQGEIMRGIAADNILARADANPLLQFMPASDNLRSLIRFGLLFGYTSVGLVLMSLFLATIRWGNAAHLEGLKRRLFIIRVGLVLGSAILVVVVLSSRAVFDWPLSLLVEADRKALAPAADALVRKWGAIGSISLIAAFLPAITAWYLDRTTYRRTPQPKKQKAKAPPDEGELEIAPWGTVTSVIAVLAPVIASPIFDAFKSLATAIK